MLALRTFVERWDWSIQGPTSFSKYIIIPFSECSHCGRDFSLNTRYLATEFKVKIN